MRLRDLIENNAITSIGDTEITSVTDDTRKVKKGSLFVCIKGGSFDGPTSGESPVRFGTSVYSRTGFESVYK